MENRNLILSFDQAKKGYNGTDAELKELALKTYPELAEKKLPKSWEELERIEGWFSTEDSELFEFDYKITCSEHNRNIFATQEQAEASIALAQLSQLMKVYNGDWTADWMNGEEAKLTIEFYKGDIWTDSYRDSQRFLTFKDAKTRDLFLENFRELILKAKPLL